MPIESAPHPAVPVDSGPWKGAAPNRKYFTTMTHCMGRRSWAPYWRIIVSENVLEPGPQDYDRINVLVEAELEYWTSQFGVSRAQLAAAIEQVGPRIADLRKVLGEPG